MNWNDISTPLVIDNGSDYLKYGLPDDEKPKLIPNFIEDKGKAIEYGIIKNFEKAESLWEQCFQNIKISNTPCLLTEPPKSPNSNKEKMSEIFFEKYKSPVLSLYSTGKYTSMIIECGHEVTQFLPIYSGAVMENGIEKYNYGGSDISNFISKSLQIKDEKEIRKIKEKHCFISENFKDEKFEKLKYELPDGKVIEIEKDLYTIPEFLFQPNLIGLESLGISTTIQNSIQKCEIDTKKEISESVILAGGTTRLKGFKERIQKDISSSYKWKVDVSHTENEFSAWIGGSIIVAHQSFNNLWFNKKEYDEYGVKYVHQKCS